MITALALAALALLQPESVPLDTGWQQATNNLWPYNPPTFTYQVAALPKTTTWVQPCLEMQGDCWIALRNDTASPMWCAGDISYRYRQSHDIYGWSNWWHQNAGFFWEVPQSNPLAPGEVRLIHCVWAATACEVQPSAEPWKSSFHAGQFDAYYPAVVHVNGVPTNPNDETTWEPELIAWVAGTYHDGTGAPPPIGRLVGDVLYQ